MSPTDLQSPNEILEAAGLSDLTGPRADFAYRKIVNDHEVLEIAERLAREAFIIPALQSMDLGQLSRLAKRARPEPSGRSGNADSTAEPRPGPFLRLVRKHIQSSDRYRSSSPRIRLTLGAIQNSKSAGVLSARFS